MRTGPVLAGQPDGEVRLQGGRQRCHDRSCWSLWLRARRSVAAGAVRRCIGADVAFGAAAGFAAGAQWVVVAAVVVAVPSAVAPAHLVAVGADTANTAFDNAFEQPLAGFRAARAPSSVVGSDAAGGEQLIGDDAGAVDGDPFVAVARDLPIAVGGAPVGHRLGAVVVDPADVGLVTQQPAEGGMAPGGLAGRRPTRSLAGLNPHGSVFPREGLATTAGGRPVSEWPDACMTNLVDAAEQIGGRTPPGTRPTGCQPGLASKSLGRHLPDIWGESGVVC